jgi:hypothetical protein
MSSIQPNYSAISPPSQQSLNEGGANSTLQQSGRSIRPAASQLSHSPLAGLATKKTTASTTISKTATAPGDVKRPLVGQARQSLEMAAIASEFATVTSEAATQAAAFRAIAFYTRNSTRINAPLRAGDNAKLLDQFSKAVNYGLERLPDYGQIHGKLDRRVHFSREMLDAILRVKSLDDPAFISTSGHSFDSSAYSLRNTLIHIEAKYAADVSGISPDPHARENLLRSGSTLDLVKANVHEVVDEDDPLFGSQDEAFRAELWMRQKTPELGQK